jgi:hypothetical protein
LITKLASKTTELGEIALSWLGVRRLLHLYDEHVCIVGLPAVDHDIRQNTTTWGTPVAARIGKPKALDILTVPIVVHIHIPARELAVEAQSKPVGESGFRYVVREQGQIHAEELTDRSGHSASHSRKR